MLDADEQQSPQNVQETLGVSAVQLDRIIQEHRSRTRTLNFCPNCGDELNRSG